MGRTGNFALIFIVLLFLFICIPLEVISIDYPPQPALKKLEIHPLHNDQPAIGYNEFDGYYADLRWEKVESPNPPELADKIYINFYLQEVGKSYKPASPLELKYEKLHEDTVSLRMGMLKPGTIYYTYARAYYIDLEEGRTVYTSSESLPSNSVKFLTDISIEAEPYGPNQIKIVWDDVWNSGERMNYKLYVSESQDFSNTPPIYITSDLVGPGKPISVDEVTGKLEYIYRVPDPARVYYIKIMPDTADTSLKYTPESETVTVSSYILARTTRMASNDFGTIWKMEWTPVITGLGAGNVDILYHIYRGTAGSGELPQYIAATDDTTFFITLTDNEEDYYFIIKAIVTRNGQDLYPGIKIESERIEIKESEVPAQPPAPELVDEITNKFGDIIVSYDEYLSSDSATVFWRTPVKDGSIDKDISYDIWLITDPTRLDNPSQEEKIISSLLPGEGNFVMHNNEIRGCKYNLSNLNPNTTYYFKIVAKKTFIDYVEGVLKTVILYSEPSFKTVITKTDGSIEQPVVPSRPPLKIKTGPPPLMLPEVSESTAVISLKNKWYEYFDSEENKWVYTTHENMELMEPGIIELLEQGTYTGSQYRIVSYDEGVTIDVGCIEYDTDLDLAGIPADKVVAFPTAPNDPDENPNDNPDGQKHNIDIIISDLLPNTTYIIWVRAARLSAGLISGPSDPIVVTTDPEIEEPLEKPVVPEFKSHYPGDNHVGLGWDADPKYNYYIKYSTQDNIEAALKTVHILPEDLIESSTYRIEGLEIETLYYFWIQAEAVGADNQTKTSEWSSSYPVKTLPLIPPDTPVGFGMAGITANSITFEWIKQGSLEYVLELSESPGYDKSEKYSIQEKSTYKAEGLKSNVRYYARLYAFDRERNVLSKPTSSISMKTLRSGDDYDSDQDTEKYLGGDIVISDPVLRNGVWYLSILNSNADRFIEIMKTDNVFDYIIDLVKNPFGTRKIRLSVEGKVFTALAKHGENLILKYPQSTVIIRPLSFYSAAGIDKKPDLVFDIDMDTRAKALSPKTPVLTNIQMIAVKTGGNMVKRFDEPVKTVFDNVSQADKSTQGIVGLSSRDGIAWQKHDLDENNPLKKPGFDMHVPGYFTLGIEGKDKYYDISSSKYRDSINILASEYDLQSIKGNSFYPDKKAAIGDAVKLALDIMDYGYDSNYMTVSLRSGLIAPGDVFSQNNPITREKAIFLAIRLYEMKTGSKIFYKDYGSAPFNDLDQVSEEMASRVSFAIRNGVVSGRNNYELGPKDHISRAELTALLEKAMRLAGEF